MIIYANTFIIQPLFYTDNKPFVHLFKYDFHENIYGHWADQLRRLNIEIKYVPKPRNIIIDGLSKTLFDKNCTKTATVIDIYETMRKKIPNGCGKITKTIMQRCSPDLILFSGQK